MNTTAPDWLGRYGVRRVHGHTFARSAGPTTGKTLAALLAEADGTVGPGIGATWDGEVLTLLSRRPDVADRYPLSARSIREFDDIVAAAAAESCGSVAVRIDFDARTADWGTTWRRVDPSLAPRFRARGVSEGERLDVDIIVVGAGVVRAGMVGELARLAEVSGLGVLNAFTAKGVFVWDSPYHLGTAFLQERDLELAGIGPQTRVLMIGVDADECPPVLLDRARVRSGPNAPIWSVPATALPELGGWVHSAHGERPQPGKLYRVLAELVQPMYQLDTVPFAPPRAAVELLRALPTDGSITVEPGIAGMWVARTIPTTRLRSVQAPAAGRPGSAVAAALNLAMSGRPALAVIDAPVSSASQELMELASSRGLSLVVAEWGPEGDFRTVRDYADAVAAALSLGGVHLIRMAVDLTMTTLLTDAVGPLVAWSGR